jgi:hypothetical protein
MPNVSRGERHSLAVRRGIQRWRERPSLREIIAAEQKANRAAINARIWRGMVALLEKTSVPIPTPDEIEAQLKKSWKAGYVRALLDVKRERERMEAQRYRDALPKITTQELRRISHAYEK